MSEEDRGRCSRTKGREEECIEGARESEGEVKRARKWETDRVKKIALLQFPIKCLIYH